MSLTKLVTLAAVVAAAVFVGGVVLRAQPAPGDPPRDPVKRGPVEPTAAVKDPAPTRVPKALLEKRAEAARKVYQQNLTRLKGGQGLPSELFGWSERWLDAELALAEKPADRAKALQAHLDRTREVERMTVGFAKAGQGRLADADAATYYRLEAEIRLHREGVTPQELPEEQRKTEKK